MKGRTSAVTQTIVATFEDGVLKPAELLNLPEHSKVRITIELPDEWEARKEQRLAALEALWKITRPHSEHLTRDQLHERR
jgi:predicted DNA-binding antitoxin AbrB/MazE fold protein